MNGKPNGTEWRATANRSYSFGKCDKPLSKGDHKMKRFLGIVVASMFLGSAVYAAQEDRKVGIVGEQKTPDEATKSDVKSSGSVPDESRGSKEDRKVGFTGEQKTGEKAKSADTKAGPASERKTPDRKVGFTGEEKKAE